MICIVCIQHVYRIVMMIVMIIIVNIRLFIRNLDDMTNELTVKLIFVKEKHLGHQILIVFNRELVVMHPSSEIMSSLFLFRKETRHVDSTCRRLTQIALNRLESAARANCIASRATGNSRFEGDKFPFLFWKIPV